MNWCPAPERLPNGSGLHKQAQRAKEASSAGLDGWRPAEVRLIPRTAWEARAALLKVMYSTWKTHKLITMFRHLPYPKAKLTQPRKLQQMTLDYLLCLQSSTVLNQEHSNADTLSG